MENFRSIIKMMAPAFLAVMVAAGGLGAVILGTADEVLAAGKNAANTKTVQSGVSTEKDTADKSAVQDAGTSSDKRADKTEDKTAAENTAKKTGARVKAAAKYTKARRITLSSYDLTFTNKVIKEKQITGKRYTNTLKATGKRKSIKLTWKPAKDTSTITGYIILRKDLGRDRWRQIASVKRTAKSYTDKTASMKNRLYQYTMVSYSKTDEGCFVSKPADWAGAVTTRSSGNNVKKITLTKAAWTSAIARGTGTRARIKLTKDAFDSELRWTSKDKKIARVSSSGVIKGVSPGSTTITARAHSGVKLDIPVEVIEPGTAEGMISVMESWLGYSYYNGGNKGIVDIYNSVRPFPRGYKMTYYDAWCAAAISAAAIRSGNADIIGRECSCDRFVDIFRKAGIWIENEKIMPKVGDIIIYTWTGSQSRTSHIGVVSEVGRKEFTVIEGNKGVGVVDTRVVKKGWWCIRGFARPAYSKAPKADEGDQ